MKKKKSTIRLKTPFKNKLSYYKITLYNDKCNNNWGKGKEQYIFLHNIHVLQCV